MARILSLDDELGTVTVLGAILQNAGYESLHTTNDQEALTILRTKDIDLFTQDFVRPGGGGCEFLRKMKADEALRRIPVLGISAWTRENVAEELGRAGLEIDRDLDGYLRKPITSSDLLRAVEAILTKHAKPLPPRNTRARPEKKRGTKWKKRR